MLLKLRLLYAFLIPVAGCVLLKLEGWEIGGWWAFGLAMALFIYHYLALALYETHRLVPSNHIREGILFLLTVVLIGLLVQWNWRDWLIEQTLLEAGAFSGGIAVLAVVKGAKEGKAAPWWLIVLVFILPAVAFLYVLLPVWAKRHPLPEDGIPWPWVIFGAAFLLALRNVFLQMKPFATGTGRLVEPLMNSRRIVGAVLWFFLLMIGSFFLAA